MPVAEEIPYSAYTVIDLLDAFASNEPFPGGGSAGALAGATGVSLLIMAAGLAKTRTGAPEEAADLSEASARLRPLRDSLVTLIDRDSQAYRAVIDAFRLPKASDAETRTRATAVQQAMQGATEVPLDTMRACQQALRGAIVVARNALSTAKSDVATGIELLLAGLRGSAMNIDANLQSVKDAAFAARIRTERDQLVSDGEADAQQARRLLGYFV